MTDLSSLPRRSPEPANPESVSDVLASIRRLIAQDDGRGRREPPPPRRAQVTGPEAGAGAGIADEPAPLDLLAPVAAETARPTPTESAPLRLHSASLIAPAEPAPSVAPAEVPRPRLRLATLAGALSNEPEIGTAANAPTDFVLEPDTAVTGTPADIAAATEAPSPQAGRPTAPAWPASPAAAQVQAVSPAPGQSQEAPVAREVTPDPAGTPAISTPAPAATAPRPAHAAPADDSTALHLFAPADEDIPNGSILRSLLREAIRQELQGEMGGRFSRNLRRVIRQEVAFAVAEAMRAKDA